MLNCENIYKLLCLKLAPDPVHPTLKLPNPSPQRPRKPRLINHLVHWTSTLPSYLLSTTTMDSIGRPFASALNAFLPMSTSKSIALDEREREDKLLTDKDADSEPKSKRAEFKVEGMTCGACVEVSRPRSSSTGMASS